MKTPTIFLLLVCFFFGSQCNAQDTLYSKKLHYIWMKDMSGIKISKSVLFTTKDSSIVTSSSFKFEDYPADNFLKTEYYIKDIYRIKTRRKNRILRGTAYGFGVGALVGVVAFAGYWDWFAKDERAQGFGALVGIFGGTFALFGAAIASIKVSIPIKGSKENYNANRILIDKKALFKQSTIK